MEIIVKDQVDQMSRSAARVVAKVLNAKPNAVLGLATGSTPLGLYKELIRMHKDEGLDFSQVTSFNLDEYVGLKKDHPQSYYYFMHENLFKHINIPTSKIYIPSGTTDNYEAFCAWYEQRIVDCGGVDLQVLGIGGDGHIAFNEPTSSLARLAHPNQNPRQADDRRQRPILRFGRRRTGLRDHDGRGHDPRSAKVLAVGQRSVEGGGGGRDDRGPRDQHDHGQRLAVTPRRDVHHRSRRGQWAEDARVL